MHVVSARLRLLPFGDCATGLASGTPPVAESALRSYRLGQDDKLARIARM